MFTYAQQASSQRKSEPARVRCIWELTGQLLLRSVGSLVLESRQEHNDRKDRREIFRAQRAGVAPKAPIYRHDRPREEPLLWIPDAVIGAIALSAALNEHTYRDASPDGLSNPDHFLWRAFRT